MLGTFARGQANRHKSKSRSAVMLIACCNDWICLKFDSKKKRGNATQKVRFWNVAKVRAEVRPQLRLYLLGHALHGAEKLLWPCETHMTPVACPKWSLYIDAYRRADASLFAHRLCFWWCAALICCFAHTCHACAIDTTHCQEMPSSCAFDAFALCGAHWCRICTGLLGSVVAGRMQCEVISGALTLGSKTLTWQYVQCRAAIREATRDTWNNAWNGLTWYWTIVFRFRNRPWTLQIGLPVPAAVACFSVKHQDHQGCFRCSFCGFPKSLCMSLLP